MQERIFGWVSVVGVLVFVVIVVSLHFVQTGYDATNQLMSELALGPYGGLMYLAFGGLAVATLGAAVGASSGTGALVLRGLLVGASLFFAIAGIFTLGTDAQIHIVSVSVGFVLIVLAMCLGPRCGEKILLPGARSSWSLQRERLCQQHLVTALYQLVLRSGWQFLAFLLGLFSRPSLKLRYGETLRFN